MPSEIKSSRLLKLDGKNYGLWKKQYTISLRSRGLSKAIEKGSDATQQQDDDAMEILFGGMESHIAVKVAACEKAADL